MQAAGATNLLKFAAQPGHASADEAPVGLDLGLARPSEKAEAPALALKMRPRTHQPPRLIIKVGKLDLKPPFGGRCTFPEDLKDQARAVDDLAL